MKYTGIEFAPGSFGLLLPKAAPASPVGTQEWHDLGLFTTPGYPLTTPITMESLNKAVEAFESLKEGRKADALRALRKRWSEPSDN